MEVTKTEIPVWEKYTLSVEEAAAYFRIGENKLRNLISRNNNAKYLLWNGNRVQIKRNLFEKFIDETDGWIEKLNSSEKVNSTTI